MKKTFFLISILISIYILFPSPSFAYVNIIEHWDSSTIQKIQQNYGDNAWVVAVGSPYSEGFADVINSYSFNWVIRGHAHWKPIGQKMYSDPEGAASDWNTFFSKLNKKVYFQPWNEPTSIDPECYGDQLSTCVPKIARFINALDKSKIKLTTPAFDPHNQENTAAQLVSLLKNNGVNFGKFEAATINVYSPNLAKQLPSLLSQWGVPSMPIIVTESGIIVNGSVTYEAKPLCEDMFCNGVVNFWQSNGQIIGWSMFSNYQGWNLWEHECVIDALKGNCHCEDCEEEDGKKAIAKEMYERTGGETPSLDDPNLRVGRNWPGGATTMEANQTIWQFLLSLIRIIFDEVKPLFRIIPGRGPIAAIADLLGLGSQDLVPSDRNGRYPGEDYYVERILTTNKLELPGTTAAICLPERDINYTFKYFPDQHPDEFVVELINLTSIHEQISNSLQVYAKMRHWVTGSAYSDYLEHIDMSTKEGEKKMAKRSLTELFRAGYISKRLPGDELRIEEDQFANRVLKNLLASGDPTDEESPLAKSEDIESGIPIADKPLARACSSGENDLVTENEFNLTSDDHRVRRDEAEGCVDPYEIKPDLMTCCNRDHVENVLGLNYDKVCEDTPGWACIGDEPSIAGQLIWGKFFRGKLAADSGISETDWPIYLEQCFEAKEEECDEHKSYHGLFADLTGYQRGRIFPPSTWDNPSPQNTYLTRAKGKCLSCQIVKLFLPQGLGALDACRHMTSTFLPGSMYEEMINKNYPQKKPFPCNVGELPYTDAEEANKDNADYKNFQKPWGEERGHGLISSVNVNNEGSLGSTEETIGTGITDPVTGEEIMQTIQVPKRRTTNVKVKSYMHLYVPHYEKLQLCTDLYYGLLPGKDAEELENDLEKRNDNKLQARDLLEKAKVNDSGSVYSGLDTPGDRVNDYLTNPGKIWGYSDVEDKEIYLPGGGTDAGVNASQRIYIPDEMQDEWLGTL